MSSARQDEQSVQLSTLDQFTAALEFGMNAAVIVGNNSGYRFEDWIVTPRGYHHKYSLTDGEARAGQMPGRFASAPRQTIQSQQIQKNGRNAETA
ncbi:hypothetical protein P4S72_00870 [Vibrio sp. PP-XX7]